MASENPIIASAIRQEAPSAVSISASYTGASHTELRPSASSVGSGSESRPSSTIVCLPREGHDRAAHFLSHGSSPATTTSSDDRSAKGRRGGNGGGGGSATPNIFLTAHKFKKKAEEAKERLRRRDIWMNSWTHAAIVTFMISLYVVGSIVLFSSSGGAIASMRFARHYHHWRMFGFGFAAFVVLLMHLLDCATWEGKWAIRVRRALLIVIALALVNGVLLSWKDFPAAGLFFSVLGLPIFTTAVHALMASMPCLPRETGFTKFAKVCVKPLAVLSVLSAIWWIMWLVLPPFVPGDYKKNHWWNDELKAQYASDLYCPRFASADQDAPALSHSEEEDYISKVEDGKLVPGVTDDDYVACFLARNSTSGDLYGIMTKDTSGAVKYQCNTCLAPFVLWAQPAVLSVALATYASLAYYLGAGHSVPRKFSSMLGMILIAVWVAAGLGSLGGNLSAAICSCVLAGFIALAACDMYAHGFDSFKQHFANATHDYEMRLAGYEDVLRGAAVYSVSPLLVVYLAIESMHQGVRVVTANLCPCEVLNEEIRQSTSQAPPDLEGAAHDRNSGASSELDPVPSGPFWLSLEARRYLQAVASWDWTRVLTFGCYVGLGYMTTAVLVGRMTNVLLSVLIEQFEAFSWAESSGMFIVVGVAMFLCPVIPGVPVYLTGGIILTAKCKDDMGEAGAMAYAICVCLVLKLCASVIQQKGIGENLAGSLAVRRTIGVNSTFVRAMRLILQEPGLTVSKITVLSAGPDWPTSVLCGVLRLPIMPIIFGTIPVLMLIVPTVLAGGFMYLSGSPEATKTQSTLTTMFTAIFGLVMILCSGVMVACVNDVLSSRGEEIAAMPIDEEVEAADAANEQRAKLSIEAVRWPRVHAAWRVVLVLALMCFSTATYIVAYNAGACFKDFALGDPKHTVELRLDGNVFNIVKPTGQLALSIFAAGSVLLLLFQKVYAGPAALSYIEGIDEYKEDTECGTD